MPHLTTEMNGLMCTSSPLIIFIWLISCSPGYIAGVTNPIFESAGQWDLLCDIASVRMVVNKDINQAWPPSQSAPPVAILPRASTLKSEGSFGHEDDLGRVNSQGREKDIQSRTADLITKSDNQDNAFIEDVGLLLMRFTSWNTN